MSAMACCRAEHVGSLLRPPSLIEARRNYERARDSGHDAARTEALRLLEDRAIAEAVVDQERLGFEIVTDGEFRRLSWFSDFLNDISGLEMQPAADGDDSLAALLPFTGGRTAGKWRAPRLRVTGRLAHRPGTLPRHFEFLRRLTSATPKITIPSPTILHFWEGDRVIDARAYSGVDDFMADAVDVWSSAIRGLHSAGCRHVQLDDVSFGVMCDERCRAALRARGDDPTRLAKTYVAALNAIIARSPAGMTFAVHVCRGNFRGNWLSAGGYEPIAETLFGEVKAGRLLLEFDSERAGDFAPLRFVRPGTVIVLGLVSTKTCALEAAEDLKRRVGEASTHAPHAELWIGPQCGFASDFRGNPLSADDQRRKLELVTRVARDVWR